MRIIRFTIGRLLCVILVLGIALAALKESSDLWESGIFSVTLVVLLASILLAVHRTESSRAFWIGFALFGLGYLGLSLRPVDRTKADHDEGACLPGFHRRDQREPQIGPTEQGEPEPERPA